MDQCSIVREQMPELLNEGLSTADREAAHQHIERCAVCAADWSAAGSVWGQLGNLPELPVPGHLRESFLAEVRRATPHRREPARILAFVPPALPRWIVQAAAAALLVTLAFFAGRNTSVPRMLESPATVQSVEAVPFSLAERAVLPASQVNPEIQGRPSIQNVRFQQTGLDGSRVAVSFDITSQVTITGNPDDKTLVNLLSYVLQNRDYPTHSRSNAIQWVGETYAGQGTTDPEIVKALANVLRNDSHEGVRIKAVEALKSLPPSLAPECRAALVEALKNDPNPAVRIKAVEALANLAAIDAQSIDLPTLDVLREKAGQEDENLYVRVKAAEALSEIKL
jgi:hypothetical protein